MPASLDRFGTLFGSEMIGLDKGEKQVPVAMLVHNSVDYYTAVESCSPLLSSSTYGRETALTFCSAGMSGLLLLWQDIY